jgi:hypothetical protein
MLQAHVFVLLCGLPATIYGLGMAHYILNRPANPKWSFFRPRWNYAVELLAVQLMRRSRFFCVLAWQVLRRLFILSKRCEHLAFLYWGLGFSAWLFSSPIGSRQNDPDQIIQTHAFSVP